jgi:hypothetical protein
MGWTSSRRRRVGIAVAVLLPLGILIQGLSQVGAQFPNGGQPKPPGFNPPGGVPPGFNPPGGVPPGLNPPGGIPPGFNPPGGAPPAFNPPGGFPPGFNPPGGGNPPGFNPPMGPTFPKGPTTIVCDWRCSKCNRIVATTTSPFKPGVDNCPNCGVHFINGGKSFLNPPANLPPANLPPGGLAPPNGAPPGFVPPNGAPPGFVPPNGPPAGFVPPNNLPGGVAPPVAPPMDFAPPMPPPANFQPPVMAMENPPVQVVVAHGCRWCSGEVSPGSRYCTGCKVKLGAVVVGGTILALGVVLLAMLIVVGCLVRRSPR